MVVLEEILFNIINYKLFGNPLYKYFISIFILLSYFIITKITKKILQDYILKFVEKSSIKFDDILFNSLNPPLNIFIFAGLYYLSIHNLKINDTLLLILKKTFNLLIIFPVVYFLIKFTTEFLGFYLKRGRRKSDEAAIDLLIQIIRVSLIIIGFLLILDNLGYEVSTLIAGLGVGGLAFALAAQDLLKNFFAGITIIFDKTFSKGDRIKINNNIGFVEKITLRNTKIRTLDNTLLTIPNSLLTENILENIQKADKYKVAMTIGLTYSTDTESLKKAKEIIEKILKEDKDIEKYWVWFDEFGPYSLNIQVIYFQTYNYSNWPERALVKERINFKIKEELEKINVEMAFPTQTIELIRVTSDK